MFRVLTLNLNFDEGKHGPWAARRARIKTLLQKEKPDLLALQAVLGSVQGSQENQASELKNSDYTYSFFQPTRVRVDGRKEGMAWVAREPLSDVSALSLSQICPDEDPFGRAILHAYLEKERLHVFNIHVSWVQPQAHQNISEAMGFLRAFQGRRLLLGDFNQSPESAELVPLKTDGWIDLWGRLPGSDGATFEAGHPSHRIDYIWADPTLQSALRSIHVVGDAATSAGDFSDHLGVLAALDV